MGSLVGGGVGCGSERSGGGRVGGREIIGVEVVDARFRKPVPMRKAILHLKKADPVLRSLIGRVGAYRIEYRYPGFETLVRSIVYQQLSGKVAKVIFDRLVDAARGQLTPRAIRKLRPAPMR